MRASEKEKHLNVFYCVCYESYNTRHILLKRFSRYALPDVDSRVTHLTIIPRVRVGYEMVDWQRGRRVAPSWR